MTSIRHAHALLKNLVRAQEDVLHSFDTAEAHIAEDKKAVLLDLKDNVENMIPAEDAEVYATLSRAASRAEVNYDFFVTAEKWKEEDRVNREERQLLEVKWGSRPHLAKQIEALDKDISTAQGVLDVINPEIEAFDKATVAIRAHNERYPRAQINEENHNKYEKSSLWRAFLGATYLKRAPYEAERIIKTYTDQFGDYYEDAKAMDGLHRSKKEFTGQLEEKTKARDEMSKAGARMVGLDSSYRGPGEIASDIRQTVAKLILENKGFAHALVEEVKTVSVRQAVTAAIKIHAYADLTGFLQRKKTQAKDALENLKENERYLKAASDKVGEEKIFFNESGLQLSAGSISAHGRDIVRKTTEASHGLKMHYRESPDPRQEEKEIGNIISIMSELSTQPQGLDFQELRAGVKAHVDAYDREQQRLAEIQAERDRQERIARERRQQEEARALAEAARLAFQVIQQRQQQRSSAPKPAIPRTSEGIRMGTRGIRR